MKELVVNEAESVCMTTDCWTSRNNESFMAITIHFIDSKFKLRLVLLGCFQWRSQELPKGGFNDHFFYSPLKYILSRSGKTGMVELHLF
ncbi:zinc finger BED domain-containing protein 4-like [Aphis craccivora]|uniref:Zinc finger BED domain-containing protein 4-like n=1 Tax=Aphis craccivora TaxID=307492 RepID=A0A6G0VJS2_APHCR|nr:zinc finger BED domain-containing protein 4-like [Aphis craccivora]